MGENVQEFTFTGTIADSVDFEASVKPKRTRKDVAKDMETLRKEDKQLAQHEENLTAATTVYDMYDCYIEAGFDEEQAWMLVLEMIKNANK